MIVPSWHAARTTVACGSPSAVTVATVAAMTALTKACTPAAPNRTPEKSEAVKSLAVSSDSSSCRWRSSIDTSAQARTLSIVEDGGTPFGEGSHGLPGILGLGGHD